MSFPTMSPQSITFIPSNAKAAIAAQPFFVPVEKCYITGASVVSGTAITGNNTNYVAISLIQLANASNVVATINLASGTNATVNAVTDLTINSTLNPVAAGTVLGLTVAYGNTANINMALAMYQLDYIQGSPASEG
jgi:hypothetical protein